MSLKQLEKAIKNRHNTNIVEWRGKHPEEPMTMFEKCACDLELQFRMVEVEFDKFKKQVVCIPRKQLGEQLDVLMKSLEPLTIGDRESFRAFKNKLLEESK